LGGGAPSGELRHRGGERWFGPRVRRWFGRSSSGDSTKWFSRWFRRADGPKFGARLSSPYSWLEWRTGSRLAVRGRGADGEDPGAAPHPVGRHGPAGGWRSNPPPGGYAVGVLPRSGPGPRARGLYLGAILGEPSFWTLVGTGRTAPRPKGSLDTDGRLEIGKAACSVEPFLTVDGRLLTWERAGLSTQPEGRRPSPFPRSAGPALGLELTVTAFAVGRDDSTSLARFRPRPALSLPGWRAMRCGIWNRGPRPCRLDLVGDDSVFQASIRHAQFLNTARRRRAPSRDRA